MGGSPSQAGVSDNNRLKADLLHVLPALMLCSKDRVLYIIRAQYIRIHSWKNTLNKPKNSFSGHTESLQWKEVRKGTLLRPWHLPNLGRGNSWEDHWCAGAGLRIPLPNWVPSWRLEITLGLSTYITKSANATNQSIVFSWKTRCQNINHTHKTTRIFHNNLF